MAVTETVLHGAAEAPTPARLTVSLTTAMTLPGSARDGVIREVEAIWAREGVHLAWVSSPGAVAAPGLRVLVVSTAGTSKGSPDHQWAVAELLDDADGRPVAIASVSAARRVLAAAGLADGPEALIAQRLGVVLGRAVAHEIGHYLLNTAGHARHGLMRARIDASDFADLRSGGFGLDDAAALWARTWLARAPADPLRHARFVHAR